MDIPMFSNGKKQDLISAKIWLETFEQAATRLNFSNDKKCMELYLHLEEPALAWWPTLKHHDIDPFSEWEKVKSRFLLDFRTNQESNQADFKQKPSEPDLSRLTKKGAQSLGRMQTPPPPPPHRKESLEPPQQKQLIDQLRTDIRTRIANYQRKAILEQLCKTEAALTMSDTNLVSLLDNLSLRSELSHSKKEKPASTPKWPPSPTLAHLPDVANRTYTVPFTEPRPKQWLPQQQLGIPGDLKLETPIGADPNTSTPIGPDPNHRNYTGIQPRPRYLPSTNLIPDQKEMKRCWYCHLLGHCENVCRKRIANRHPQTEPHLREVTWCNYCHIPGHTENVCRKKIYNQRPRQYSKHPVLAPNPSPGLLGPAPTRPPWTLFRESTNSHPVEHLAALLKALN